MKTSKNKKCIIVLTIIVLVLFSFFLKFAGYFGFNYEIAKIFRSFIYIFIFCTWGISLKNRITQSQPRKYLTGIAFFFVFWLIVRTLRYDFIKFELFPNFHRWLWYMYYIPILFIPLFSTFASMLIGKPENYRLPKKANLLYIPTVFFAVLVLTNDLHQTVFDFHIENTIWTDSDYSYGWGYYLTVGWIVFCILCNVFDLFTRRRREKNLSYLVLSCLPLVFVAVYVFLYCINIKWLRLIFSDMTIFTSALSGLYFETAIHLGFIQVNSSYKTLLSNAADIPVQITDNDYNVQYISKQSHKISAEQMQSAKNSPIEIQDGIYLHNMSIHGGHAIWIEDMTELIKLQHKLEEMREELDKNNALLQEQYAREKEHKIVEEQNRLYDLLQNYTQTQMDKISQLEEQYRNTDDKAQKKYILKKIVVLGSFIKRRKDFVLCIDSSPTIPETKLKSAFGESYRSLKLMNIGGTYFVNTGNEYCNGKMLSLAYDFFEETLETALDSLRNINVRVTSVNKKLRISIFIDGDGNFASLKENYPNAVVYYENSQADIYLPLS